MPDGARPVSIFSVMVRKTRILIVEDETAIRTGLIDVFVYHGFEVDTAAEGPEGLKKALSGTFDLVLLDRCLKPDRPHL